ncbi:VC0807 family protein [Streptomyces orinoci]|uniref:VC0807 family protein n=1 Tax=Streptomyces orinoci TaxID=67339 RepID=A0ABV3JZT9_STRON|nr:VC0807 family protein [Streptomyces orinoci]
MKARRSLLTSLTVNLALPLAVYYVLRGQGAPQWQALLISSAPPALHALAGALLRRRTELFDLLVLVLLVVSAGTSAISGDPRVLLLKDAALPAALALWMAGTLFTARPFAYQFGRQLRTPEACEAAERQWLTSPEFRNALRGLTLLWAGGQLLDAALSTAEALTLPVDAVPLIGRLQSIALIALVVLLTVRLAHRFRDRHGMSLFGTRPIPTPEAP